MTIGKGCLVITNAAWLQNELGGEDRRRGGCTIWMDQELRGIIAARCGIVRAVSVEFSNPNIIK
jgi:hypothetical protein